LLCVLKKGTNITEFGHHHEDSCSCGCGCGCGSGCRCGEHHHHHEDGCNCAETFLTIADEAWAEVLKDKIKEQIIAHKGEHMEKLAEMIAKANGEKWKHKIASKMKCGKFKDDLKDFFSSCD